MSKWQFFENMYFFSGYWVSFATAVPHGFEHFHSAGQAKDGLLRDGAACFAYRAGCPSLMKKCSQDQLLSSLSALRSSSSTRNTKWVVPTQKWVEQQLRVSNMMARAERLNEMITTSPYFVLTTQQWTRGLGSQFFRETSLPRILWCPSAFLQTRGRCQKLKDSIKDKGTSL